VTDRQTDGFVIASVMESRTDGKAKAKDISHEAKTKAKDLTLKAKDIQHKPKSLCHGDLSLWKDVMSESSC